MRLAGVAHQPVNVDELAGQVDPGEQVCQQREPLLIELPKALQQRPRCLARNGVSLRSDLAPCLSAPAGR
jgi:hypothetical protein